MGILRQIFVHWFALSPILGALLIFPAISAADIVKPALIEISVISGGHYKIEIRASIEALLTGINARYRDTRESPNAQAYDDLRVLQAPELERHFIAFQDEFANALRLTIDGKVTPLHVQAVEIPEPGYTKVPRNSVIRLAGSLPTNAESLQWYYPSRFGDHAVRVRQVDEQREQWHWSQWQWIKTDVASEPFSLAEIFTQRPWYQTSANYIDSGFRHILPYGRDHILFILGIFLLSVRLRPLLWQVTMFTVAHSITLALAINGIIELPARVVEPLIALSIAYIGIENILSKRLHNSRLALVFGFGLLHGLGFAGVLSEFGMPDDAFATALISFNVGVELGQLAVIAIAYAAIGFWFNKKTWYRAGIVVPLSAAIGLTGLYWTYDRIVIV